MVQVAFPVHTMKAFEEVEVKLHLLLDSPLDKDWLASRSGRSTSEEGGPVSSRASLNALEDRKMSCPCWESNNDSSAAQPRSPFTIYIKPV